MTNPYNPPELSTDYNQSPPSDDGSRTPNNEVTWAKNISKIGAPLKNYIDAVNAQAESACGVLQDQIDDLSVVVKFQAQKTSNQSITVGTATKITFTNEILDIGNVFASSTATLPEGDYFINCMLAATGITADTVCGIYIYKNGLLHRRTISKAIGATVEQFSISAIVSSDGNDTFEIYFSAANETNYTISLGDTYFEGFRI